jgi:hypothetical protein
MIVPGRRRCRAKRISRLHAIKVENSDVLPPASTESCEMCTYLEAQLVRATDSVLISRHRLEVSLDLGACAFVSRLAGITTLLLRAGGGALVS